jgi:hypothetical protein
VEATHVLPNRVQDPARDFKRQQDTGHQEELEQVPSASINHFL